MVGVAVMVMALPVGSTTALSWLRMILLMVGVTVMAHSAVASRGVPLMVCRARTVTFVLPLATPVTTPLFTVAMSRFSRVASGRVFPLLSLTVTFRVLFRPA